MIIAMYCQKMKYPEHAREKIFFNYSFVVPVYWLLSWGPSAQVPIVVFCAIVVLPWIPSSMLYYICRLSK